MFKTTFTLALHLILLINFSAISSNNLYSNVEDISPNPSFKDSYLQESGVSIISHLTLSSTTCSPPNGSAEIFEISKDGVVEEISNFTITWYDHFDNVISSGPYIAYLPPGEYRVSAVHRASGTQSNPMNITIYDEAVPPVVAMIRENNTSCDPHSANGYIEVFLLDDRNSTSHSFTWFSGTIDAPGPILPSNHDMIFGLSAGFYTVEVINNVTGCMTYASMEIMDNLIMPEMNFSVKNNTSCLSDGEIEIFEITESSTTQNLSNYEFSLFNSNNELIKKSSSPIFTDLSGGTYYLSANNNYTRCESNKTEVTVNNEYDTSGPSSDFVVVGPNADFSICGSGSITVEAKGGEHFRWYNSALEGDVLHEGSIFTVENLQETRSVFVSMYDPICNKESDRKEVPLKVINLPLISSLTSDHEQAKITAHVNGNIKWFLNGEIIEGKTESSILAYKDGNYSIEVSNSECVETESIQFSGLAFSDSDHLIVAPKISNASYEWSKNDVFLDQEKSHTLTVSENGTYSVKITFENGSGRLNEIQTLTYKVEVKTLDVVMATKSLSQGQNLKIYPLPFTNTITLEFLQDIGEKLTLGLHDMNGKLIFSKDQLMLENKKFTLDIPDLDKGIYLLEVIHSKGSYISKVVK